MINASSSTVSWQITLVDCGLIKKKSDRASDVFICSVLKEAREYIDLCLTRQLIEFLIDVERDCKYESSKRIIEDKLILYCPKKGAICRLL